MAFRFSLRDFLVTLLVGMVVVTILSIFISQYTDLETIQSGKAFLIIFIGVFVSVLWWAGYDKNIDRKEIVTLVFVAIALVVSFMALRRFVPEIFSVLPEATKQLFSAIGG